jgi:hypothetical protein
MANKKIEISNTKWNRYQDILQQINTENAMKEEVRQFESTQKFQEEQNRLNREFQADQSRIDREFKAAQAELDRKHAMDLQAAKTKAEKEKLERQHQLDMEQLAQKHKNDKALLQEEYALKKQSTTYTYSSGGSGGSGSSYSGARKTATTTNSKGQTYSLYDSNVKKAITNGSPQKYTVNTKSLTDCGLAGKSASYVANLVKEGKLKMTLKNGQYYYSWATPQLPTSRINGSILPKLK